MRDVHLPISFVQPVYLWLLLLLVPLWALTLADQRPVARWRRWLSLELRTIILIALVLALAGAQMLRRSSRMTIAFVIDRSDSVAPAMRVDADQYVQAALERMPAGNQTAIIVFGGDALIEQPPLETRQYVRTAITPSTDQTDIDQALQLALAVLPAETHKRIVLLSDGAETRGNALDAAVLARAADTPIDTVSLIAPPSADDVALEALEAPATTREGQQLRLILEARSGRSTSAQLQLLTDRQPIVEATVKLEAGTSRIPITVPAPQPGVHAWEARIDAPGDPVATNNVQFSFTEVRGPPRVLLAEGAPGKAANLYAALKSAQLNPVIITPTELPTSLLGLDSYDVVALVDVPFRALPQHAAELLPTYVRELGRGLLMVGGEESYAAGGYHDTSIEATLPVIMQAQGIKVHPDIALVLVIDRSGSMAGSKLDLAKEGAVQSFATLDEEDQIGIIAFDTGAMWIVPLQQKPLSDAFLRQLGGISIGGGTDLRLGLEQATAALGRLQAKIKHIVF